MGLLSWGRPTRSADIFRGNGNRRSSIQLLFVGGLGLINATGAPHHRGAVFSALYLVGYLSMGALRSYLALLPHLGTWTRCQSGAAAIAMTSVATLVLAATTLKGDPRGSINTISRTAVESNVTDHSLACSIYSLAILQRKSGRYAFNSQDLRDRRRLVRSYRGKGAAPAWRRFRLLRERLGHRRNVAV